MGMSTSTTKQRRKLAAQATEQYNIKRQLMPKMLRRIASLKKRIRQEKINSVRVTRKIRQNAEERLRQRGEPSISVSPGDL